MNLQRWWKRGLIAGTATALAFSALSGGVAHGQTPPSSPRLPQPTPGPAGPPGLIGDTDSLTDPALKKIDSQLRQLYDARLLGRLPQRAQEIAADVEGDSVLVTVTAASGQSPRVSALAPANGAQVTAAYRDWLDLRIPLASLPALARDNGVLRIDLPIKAEPVVLGEGVAQTGADVWQSASPTQNGTGAKVAIVDLGFIGYTALLGTELPATVDTSCNQATPIESGTVHGAGVAEIVHEMAPGATLFLVRVSTSTQLGAAVTCLISKGVTVANHSVGWMYHAAGDGTGTVNQIITDAVNGGIFWANSSGNSAQNHWYGAWADADADDILDFAAGDESVSVAINSGSTITAGLRWTGDSWSAACHDFNLYLYSNAALTTLVASSTNAQNCTAGQRPLEVLSYTAPASSTYYLVVKRNGAAITPNFDLMTFNHALESAHRVPANSLFHPADNASTGMMSVGAYNYSTPSTIESFSSQGPTTDNRLKPDIAGPDGVSGTTYGAGGFFGTSASSPHVAGAAALVKGANPNATPAQVKSFLVAKAVDAGAAGPDNLFGNGRLNMGPALFNDVIATPAILSVAPSTWSQSTTAGTITGTDPNICSPGGNQQAATTWHTYTPTATGTVGFSTVNSGYDTVLAVFSGTPGSLVQIACNDDDGFSNTTSALSASLTAGTTYYVEAAKKGTGSGGALELRAQNAAPPLPGSVAAGTITNSSIQINWTDPASDEVGFEVEWSLAGPPSWNFVKLPRNTTTWTHTGLPAGTGYQYAVRTCNSFGCSAFSAVVPASTTGGGTPPVPGNWRITGSTSSSITMCWDDVSGETGYTIAWTPSSPISYSFVGQAANTTCWTHAGVPANQTNYYHIQACNGSNCSAFSAGIVGTAAATPVMPANHRLNTTSSTSIETCWNDVSGETAYQVVWTASSPINYQVQNLAADTLCWNATGLTSGQTYFFHVRACAGANCSAWTAGIVATATVTPPVPANHRVGTVTANSVQNLWDDGTGETSYEVVWTPASPINYQLVPLAANTTSWTATGLAPNATYYFHVRACSGTTCSAFTGGLVVTTSGSAPLAAPSSARQTAPAPPADLPSAGPVEGRRAGSRSVAPPAPPADIPAPGLPARAPQPPGEGVGQPENPPAPGRRP